MVSRFIVRNDDIGFNSRDSPRLNKGQAMLRGRKAAIKDAKHLRERRKKISSKN